MSPTDHAPRRTRRVPPPFLSISLGLVGLGLVWRAASENLGAPAALGEAMVVVALAVFATVAVLFVLGLREEPGALGRDLARPAGRGSIPAGSEALMLAGAAILPMAPQAAPFVWTAGVFLHLWLAARLVGLLARMAPEDRAPTGFLVVPFCGLIVAPVGGAPMADQTALGAASIAELLFWGSLGAYLVLLTFAARRLARVPTPPHLRPGAYILLAPPAVAVVGYEKLHPEGPLTPWLFGLAAALLTYASQRRDWLTEGGFAPTWGAFTFPTVAFAGACLTVAGRIGGPLAQGAATVAVVGATAITVGVALRAFRAWRDGDLPPM